MSTYLQVPTSSIAKSISFYKALNFTLVEYNKNQFVLDGTITIAINTDRKARIEIVMEDKHWLEKVTNLPQYFPLKQYEDSLLLTDPSGVRIRLKSEIDLPNFENHKESIFGMNAGLSIETVDQKTSLNFYEQLGFNISQGGLDKDWLVISNPDGFTISLMKPDVCPHLFSNPALTFFNGKKNEEIINTIRQEKLTIIEEITHFNKDNKVDNITIMDPGGLTLFLFND